MTGERKTARLSKREARQSKTVILQHRRNWSMTLHVGRASYEFEAYGQCEVPREVLSHPDYLQQADRFLVKEK